MRSAFRWAAAAVLFLAMPAFASPAPPYSPIPQTLSSTVMVNGGCTGWSIGNDLIVTASHCLASDGSRPKIKFSNDKVGLAAVVYLAAIDEGGDDFAVLRLHVDPGGYMQPLSIDCGPMPPIGTDVYMTGYPGGERLGIGQFTSTGKVARANAPFWKWPHAIGIEMPVFGGFSGSAVRRASDNRVVGILVGGLPEQRTIAFMIPTTKLCHVLEIS